MILQDCVQHFSTPKSNYHSTFLTVVHISQFSMVNDCKVFQYSVSCHLFLLFRKTISNLYLSSHSMDGFRLVKLNEVIRQVDIVITCTGIYESDFDCSKFQVLFKGLTLDLREEKGQFT